MWIAQTAWTDAGFAEVAKTLTAVKTAVVPPASPASTDYLTVSILTNLNTTLQAQSTGLGDTWTYGPPGSSIPLHSPTRKVNIRPVKSFAVRLQGQGLNYSPQEVLVDGSLSSIRI